MKELEDDTQALLFGGDGCYYIHSKVLDYAIKNNKLNYLLNNCQR
jgi:hypothetical protein